MAIDKLVTRQAAKSWKIKEFNVYPTMTVVHIAGYAQKEDRTNGVDPIDFKTLKLKGRHNFFSQLESDSEDIILSLSEFQGGVKE